MSLALINSIELGINTATQDVIAKIAKRDDFQRYVKDLERQAEVHRNNNDNTNLQIVNNQLTTAYTQVQGYEDAINAAKQVLQDWQQKLATAKAQLTPEDLQTINARNQIALDASKANLIATEAEAKEKYSQGTTKYLIIGGVLVVVVIIVVFWFKRKKSNG